MKKLSALIAAALCGSASCHVDSDVTHQLALEMFDEPRQTTVCNYRSRKGEFQAIEYTGRYFCPRVLRTGKDESDPSTLTNDGRTDLAAAS